MTKDKLKLASSSLICLHIVIILLQVVFDLYSNMESKKSEASTSKKRSLEQQSSARESVAPETYEDESIPAKSRPGTSARVNTTKATTKKGKYKAKIGQGAAKKHKIHSKFQSVQCRIMM